MKRCISSSRKIIAALATAGVIVVTGSVFAQTVDQVLQAEQRRIQLAQASQERINTVVEGTRSLEDQYRAINKEIDLRFVLGYTPLEFRDTLHMIADGKVDPRPLITGTVGLDGVDSAFGALGDAERHAKILIDPRSSAGAP